MPREMQAKMKAAAWQEAASFAARAHRNQVRRDGRTPYFAHPARVALTIALVFGHTEDDTLTAALLHDTIEDTTTDYEDLLDRFGPRVAELVAALTKNMALPEARREKDYDAQLSIADWRARLIKLGDVYDNLCDVETQPPDKRKEKLRETLERCVRALELAREDARDHEEVDRARRAITVMMKRCAPMAR